MLIKLFLLISLAAAWVLADGLWMLPVFCAAFLGCVALAVGFVWVLSLGSDPDDLPQEDSPLIRWVVKLYAPMVFALLGTGIVASGTEKLPKSGRFLLVCNHIHALDPGVLLKVFPNAQLGFISKEENKRLPIVGPLMNRILCQSLDRENDRAALKTVLRCISLIKADKVSIGVFPEGYTSKDGHLQPFRNGVFKIAQKAQVPIVVCTLRGTRDILSNVRRLKPSRVELRLLEVIPAADLTGKTTAQIGDRIHSLMKQDLESEM